jgi:hypothetical protein
MLATHKGLDEYRHRPKARDMKEGDDLRIEIGACLQAELIAADVLHSSFVRGCAAMMARHMYKGPRTCVGKRSGRGRRAANGMDVTPAGEDYKKHNWIKGRPLICSMYGVSGSDAWMQISNEVTEEGDFDEKHLSSLRAHDGKGGDPQLATRWEDREPTDKEWVTTINVVMSLEAHVHKDGASTLVTPHLVMIDGRMPNFRMHWLKFVKPLMYATARIHPKYLVEAGGHADSMIEQMTAKAAHQQADGIFPKGLRTSLGYARGALMAGPVELDHLIFRLMRTYVAHVGVKDLPRVNSWTAMTVWAVMGVPDEEASLISMISGKGDGTHEEVEYEIEEIEVEVQPMTEDEGEVSEDELQVGSSEIGSLIERSDGRVARGPWQHGDMRAACGAWQHGSMDGMV